MQLSTRFSFYPAGQGTFSGGSLESLRNPWTTFSWIYDCGCVKKHQKQLISEIDRLALLGKSSGGMPRLDLVFVSHFDLDHVSGLVDLLSKFEVVTLVLPLIPLWQRMVLAVSTRWSSSPRLQEFLIDPLRFVAQLDGAQVHQVYLVPPSNPTSSNVDNDPNDVRPAPMPDLVRDAIVPSRTMDLPIGGARSDSLMASIDQPPFRVNALAPGGKLLVSGVWEFVPYNEPNLKIKATPTFRAAVTRVGSALLAAPQSQRSAILGRLKRIYDRTFGKRAKQRNQISLFVYAGPIGRYRAVDWGHVYFERAISLLSAGQTVDACSSGQCAICAQRDEPTTKAGILYTGDGYLDSIISFNDLRAYLGYRRLGDLRVFQVMHHGARANWHKGLARKLAPHSSVYCADPKYVYGHPHKDVAKDFKAFKPHLVNWRFGYSSFQVLEWLPSRRPPSRTTGRMANIEQPRSGRW